MFSSTKAKSGDVLRARNGAGPLVMVSAAEPLVLVLLSEVEALGGQKVR